jgi:hypothetical protein
MAIEKGKLVRWMMKKVLVLSNQKMEKMTFYPYFGNKMQSQASYWRHNPV